MRIEENKQEKPEKNQDRSEIEPIANPAPEIEKQPEQKKEEEDADGYVVVESGLGIDE